MKLKHHEIKTYVTAEDYHQVTQEAMVRRTTIAKVLRDSIREYFLLRHELSNTIETPGQLGDNHSGKIIHTLLARTEERFQMAITDVENKIHIIQEQIKVLTTMIDQLYWDLMYHLTPVHKDLQDIAAIKANQRHQRWLDEIERKLIDK